MATTTTKYGFIKPQLTDAADITATNVNWDKVETELDGLNTTIGEQGNTIATMNNTFLEQGNTLNNKINTEVAKLQTKITFGYDEPSGGYHGDVYIQLLDE